MKLAERLITDLEEEILFLLSLQETELSTLAIANVVCLNLKYFISLAQIHVTLLQLEKSGLIDKTILNAKHAYTITASGVEALQKDWNYYRTTYTEYE